MLRPVTQRKIGRRVPAFSTSSGTPPEADPVGTDQGDDCPEQQVVQDEMMVTGVDIEAEEKNQFRRALA